MKNAKNKKNSVLQESFKNGCILFFKRSSFTSTKVPTLLDAKGSPVLNNQKPNNKYYVQNLYLRSDSRL